jgi:hypothetical protein
METKVNFKQSLVAGILAAGVATIANAILFYVFHGLGVIVDTIFIQPNQPMTIVPIIISSIVPTIIASLVFFLLEKFTQNGFKIFKIVSIILLGLSFLNPFLGIQGVTIGYAIVLNVMHVTIVGALFYFIGNKTAKNS